MSDASVTLLKTCQTCFHAKIRCEKTKDSGVCDRCLRLGKSCVFAPSRRRKANRTVPVASSSAAAAAGLSAASASAATPSAGSGRQLKPGPSSANRPVPRTSAGTQPIAEDASSSTTSSSTPNVPQSELNTEPSYYNPFARGLLTYEKGDEYLNHFRTKMIPHFPFVLIPDTVTAQDLARDKPCLCVAVFCVSCSDDPVLQKSIGRLFNQMVSMRLLAKKGWFTTMDLLQALLVGLAWAHFQPRPLKYSQQLALATSIVADLRLDRPRIAMLWSLNDDLVKNNGPKLTPDEMRALAGAYYLSSSTSVLMQKARFFRYTPYIQDCCQKLTIYGGAPTDKYLLYIIHLQKLMEEVDDAVSISQSPHHLTAELQRIKHIYLGTKSTLPFALSECPTVQLQVHVLELLICQPSPDSVSFGPNGFQNVQGAANPSGLLDWLSQSLAAAKNLISILLILPPGEEGLMPNLSWVCLYSTASLAVRLDLLALHYEMGHLRRILDLTYTLRQIIIRLQTLSDFESGPDVPKNAFYHLTIRARQVEKWYSHHLSQIDPPDVRFSSSGSSPNSLQAPGETRTPAPAPFLTPVSMVPSVHVTGQPDQPWTAAKVMEFDPDISMGNMLFTGHFDFLSDGSGGFAMAPDVGFQSPPDGHMGANFDSGI